jgi:hypothetical protein
MKVCQGAWKNLQMVLIGRFCIFFTIQNRELPYANARQGKPVKSQHIFDHGTITEILNRQDDI